MSAALAVPAGASALDRSGGTAARTASSLHSHRQHAGHAKRRACHGATQRAGCQTTAARIRDRKLPLPVRSSHSRISAASQAAALQAATIARVLATPCQNTGLEPMPANLALVRAAVLCLVNTERAEHDEEPLQPNADLEAAAQSHGSEMLRLDYFDHVAPSGVTPVDRVRETGYIPNAEVGYVVGENLAWGTLSLSTPEAIVDAWIASPEHLANILEANYRETGIDVQPAVPQSLAEGVEGGLYTQEFGTITH
jgi:uncharacterized protein YkwD